MSENPIHNIMRSMGWTDGTFIPIANDENKQLMESMQQLLEDKDAKSINHQQINERVERLKNFTKNCQYEISQNLKLLDAHRAQLSDEHHLYKIAENNDVSLCKQIKEIKNQLFDLNKYDELTKDEIVKLHLNVEKLSYKIKWMKDALDEWNEAMAHGDQTNKLIQKYCKEDEQKANSLEHKRKTLQGYISKNRITLINVHEEQKSLENILNRTAQLYRQAHLDRRQMVETWKEAVKSMNSRDKDISATEQEAQNSLATINQKNQELKEQLEFLEHHQQDNKEKELQIEELNAQAVRLRNDLGDILETVANQTNEFISLRKLIQNVSSKLQQKRQKNRQLLRELEEKNIFSVQLRSDIDEIRKKYESFLYKKFNAQERLKHLDELVESEEKTMTSITSETARLGDVLFRSQQILLNWRNELKVLDIQINGLESSLNALSGQHKSLEKELIRQTEIIYNVDFKRSQLEARIDKMKGKTSAVNPETELKLISLQKVYDNRKLKLQAIKNQVLKVELDMKQLTNVFNVDALDCEKLTDKLTEKQLMCEGGDKKLKQLTVVHQERLVEESIVKMRVHQMEELIKKQNNKLYNLEKHKVELEFAMHERLSDIKMQKDILTMKRKHLLDELSQLRADVGDRNLKIDAMIARYENAVELLGKNYDGSVISATQIKIETAQEKQILLREGNELNEKVMTAEKDIKAIENTLLLLNYSNDRYKKTFEQVEDNNKEMLDFNNLNNQYCKTLLHLKESKLNLSLVQHEIRVLKERHEEMEKDLDDISRFRMENNDTLMKIHKEILDQKSKMERAEREFKCARKSAKQKIQDREFLNSFEKDLNIKELEERNTSALQQLADMVDSVSGMGPVVTKHLYEKGLSIPAQQGSRLRSQTSHRSDHSGQDTEYSLKLGSGSSKVSHGSASLTGGSSICSSKKTGKSCATTSATGPSIIVLDFPGEAQSSRHSIVQRSSRKK